MTRTTRSVLIIGYPGAVAEQVCLALCREGHAVDVLVPPDGMRAARALRRVAGESLQIIAAEPHCLDFGLAGPAYMELAGRTGIVLSLLPAVPGPVDAGPGILNRIGREIVEFCRASSAPPALIHLSAIDVRGDFKGRFAERDLDVGQRFHLTAHQERFRNERIFLRFREVFSTCVIRAGVIAGNGVDLFPIVPMMLAEQAFFARYDTASLYLTPLDGLVRLITWLVACPEAAGSDTFHYFQESPMSPRHLALHLCALAAEKFPAGEEPGVRVRRVYPATGFTARTFWQHNSGNTGAENLWTTSALAERGFPAAQNLEMDWDRLVADTVDAMKSGEPGKAGT